MSHQSSGPLHSTVPRCIPRWVEAQFEICEEGCHIYLEILHRSAGFEKIYLRVISRKLNILIMKYGGLHVLAKA